MVFLLEFSICYRKPYLFIYLCQIAVYKYTSWPLVIWNLSFEIFYNPTRLLLYCPLYKLSWLLSNSVKAPEPDTFYRGNLSQVNKKHFPLFALIITAPLSIKWKSVWITILTTTDILWLILTNANNTDSYLDTQIKRFLCAVLLPFPESRLCPELQQQ